MVMLSLSMHSLRHINCPISDNTSYIILECFVSKKKIHISVKMLTDTIPCFDVVDDRSLGAHRLTMWRDTHRTKLTVLDPFCFGTPCTLGIDHHPNKMWGFFGQRTDCGLHTSTNNIYYDLIILSNELR